MSGNLVPAPWTLSGIGFMHFFWGPKRVDPYSGVKVSGLGGIIIARYDESPVGPYNELLYIPGKQVVEGKKNFFISKIYVDSVDSMVSGQQNWGIPKELADISIKQSSEGISVKAGINEASFFDARLKPFGMRFPITTKIIPIPLHQIWEDKTYYTKFIGAGKGRLSSINVKQINNEYFPEIQSYTSLATISVDPFTLKFPIARIKDKV